MPESMMPDQGRAGKTARRPRGFLLIVVVGLLAVLLVMVVGFLSYTRGETNAVATIRDRTDGVNMFQSVLDYAAGTIAADLCDGSGKMKAGVGDDPKGIVSSVNAPGDACYKWWYRPYEPNMQSWYSSVVPSNHATQWCDLPPEFFNSKSMKGRYYLQVFDANALINVNDGLEDGNPTQCQMAHMLMESLGDQYLEHYRRWRDTKQNSGIAYAAPLRYLHAWHMATHTLRGNNSANNTGYSEYDTISPNWLTTNQTYLSLHDLDLNSFRIEWQGSGIIPWVHVSANSPIGPGYYFPPTRREGFVPGNGEWGFSNWGSYSGQVPSYFGGSGLNWPMNNHFMCMLPSTLSYALWSYTDPDTGRSPVNVNSTLRSMERVLNDTQFSGKSAPNCTMEAVFNVESLRRIIKVGKFYKTDGTACDLKTTPSDFSSLSDADKRKLECLRVKLAYQYQETLCRYFTATYNHPSLPFEGGLASLTRKYPPLNATSNSTYNTTYAAWLGAAEANKVTKACATYDLSKTRFPVGLTSFRSQVKADLRAMTQNNNVIALAVPKYDTTEPKDGQMYVNFDKNGIPEITPGKLDWRTASAIYDNIVPGKAYLFTSAEAPNPSVRDPLTELYKLQIGRDETQEDFYNTAPDPGGAPPLTQGSPALNANSMHTDNAALADSGFSVESNTPDNTVPDAAHRTLRSKGKDIAFTDPGDRVVQTYKSVPWRQRCFGPDWFSTELTTSSTTFYVIVTVQMIDLQTNQEAFLNQYGAVLEIAPDIMVETDANYTGDKWPDGKVGSEPTTTGLGFGRGFWGKKIKTARPPFVSAPGVANAHTYGLDAIPVDVDPATAAADNVFFRHYRSESDSQGTQWAYTAAKSWADFRGTTDDPAYAGKPSDPTQFYKDGLQNKKQVRIRAIWSLNSGAF